MKNYSFGEYFTKKYKSIELDFLPIGLVIQEKKDNYISVLVESIDYNVECINKKWRINFINEGYYKGEYFGD